MNYNVRGTYNSNSQIKFKTTMLKSSLCDRSAAYILQKVVITITGKEADVAAKEADKRKKKVIFKNWALITDRINKIKNAQVDNARNPDIVMSTYNLIEYSDNYSKTSPGLRHYNRNDQHDTIANYHSNLR